MCPSTQAFRPLSSFNSAFTTTNWFANVGFLYASSRVAVTPIVFGKARRACSGTKANNQFVVLWDHTQLPAHCSAEAFIEQCAEQTAVRDPFVTAQSGSDVNHKDTLLLVGSREYQGR